MSLVVENDHPVVPLNSWLVTQYRLSEGYSKLPNLSFPQ